MLRCANRVGVAASALLVMFAVGCGGNADVGGTVTHNGKPVVWGSVTLVDSKGMIHQGTINLEGKYSIPGVPTGRVKIGVVSGDPHAGGSGRGKATSVAETKGKKGAPEVEDPRAKFKKDQAPELPRPAPGKWFPIPDKANNPETSGITGEVVKGKPLDIVIP